jgi:hypothetical protein
MKISMQQQSNKKVTAQTDKFAEKDPAVTAMLCRLSIRMQLHPLMPNVTHPSGMAVLERYCPWVALPNLRLGMVNEKRLRSSYYKSVTGGSTRQLITAEE